MNKKNIYRNRELKFYDEFMDLEFRNNLIKDFFKTHPNYTNLSLKTDYHVTKNGWEIAPLKYEFADGAGMFEQHSKKLHEAYPTAYELVTKFGDDCPIGGYAVLNPHSVIRRHDGKENRDGKYLRVHIPLIVPLGDIGFEVAGEEVYWNDLFGFNNQKLHSAWNNTDEKRLVFIIDISTKVLGIPDIPPAGEDHHAKYAPFWKSEMSEKEWQRLMRDKTDNPND